MPRGLRRTGAAVLGAAVVLTAVPAIAGTKVVAPRSGGHYTGTTGGERELDLAVSGRSLQIVVFEFPCGRVTGRTSLTDIRLKKTTKGWTFRSRAGGSVEYSDEQLGENGTIEISGRFSPRSARTVTGLVRVKSSRCGQTRRYRWTAKVVRR